MSTFPLQIGTPDGLLFEGEVVRVVCRSITGDLAILADGTRREAACIGGMLSVMNGTCHLLATTWEWKEDIDETRAEAARKKAEEKLSRTGLSEQDYKIAKAKLHRAMVRLSVKQ